MGTFKPAKALGLDIHLLADGGLENKVRMFPLPHFNLRATICCADSQGGCLGWDRIRMAQETRDSLMLKQDGLADYQKEEASWMRPLNWFHGPTLWSQHVWKKYCTLPQRLLPLRESVLIFTSSCFSLTPLADRVIFMCKHDPSFSHYKPFTGSKVLLL